MEQLILTAKLLAIIWVPHIYLQVQKAFLTDNMTQVQILLNFMTILLINISPAGNYI